MVEFPKRWTEPGVEVELVKQLTNAHHGDEEGESSWVQTDTT
jgi:hypothetical protein